MKPKIKDKPIAKSAETSTSAEAPTSAEARTRKELITAFLSRELEKTIKNFPIECQCEHMNLFRLRIEDTVGNIIDQEKEKVYWTDRIEKYETQNIDKKNARNKLFEVVSTEILRIKEIAKEELKNIFKRKEIIISLDISNAVGDISLREPVFGTIGYYWWRKYKDEMSPDERLKVQFKEIAALPKEDRKQLLEYLKQQFEQEATEEIQLPEPGEFELYKPRTDALEHLKKHWGKYLKYFGAEENHLYQDQLKRLDQKLLQAIRNKLDKTPEWNLKTGDIIPPKTERISAEIKNLPSETQKELDRIAAAERMRKTRSTKKSGSSHTRTCLS